MKRKAETKKNSIDEKKVLKTDPSKNIAKIATVTKRMGHFR